MTKENNLVGGFTAYRNITQEDIEIFDIAFKGFVGTKYSPVAVATQVVAGTNYCFFCNAEGIYPDSIIVPSLVKIFQPLTGIPQIAHIEICKC